MRFHTTILQSGKTAAGIQVPTEIVEALGAGKVPKVRVTIRGYTYRSSVAMVNGVPMVGVSAENRAAAGVAGGDEVDVDIELDTAPREVTVPADFATALEAEPVARRAVLQQQVLARRPDRGSQERRDAPAADRQIGRGPPRGSPALSLVGG